MAERGANRDGNQSHRARRLRQRRPGIDDARRLAHITGCDRVIILYTTWEPAAQIGYASYGETRAKCGEARRLADAAFRAVESRYLAEIAR